MKNTLGCYKTERITTVKRFSAPTQDELWQPYFQSNISSKKNFFFNLSLTLLVGIYKTSYELLKTIFSLRG
jgi:hypothetical protein